MSVLTALWVFVLVLVVVNLVLTAGIIRRLRNGTTAASAGATDRATPVGLRIDLDADAAAWPPAAAGMLEGIALVAFVLPGCMGCERLHRQLVAVGGSPVPFYVITDPEAGGDQEYLATWDADVRMIAPAPADALISFDRPGVFPTVSVLSDGVVVASGHTVTDVQPTLRRLTGWRPERDPAAAQVG